MGETAFFFFTPQNQQFHVIFNMLLSLQSYAASTQVTATVPIVLGVTGLRAALFTIFGGNITLSASTFNARSEILEVTTWVF